MNADKRKAVATLLADAEWSAWSDSEIARRCAVSHDFVRRMRPSLASDASEPATRLVTTKHGTVAEMNVESIGRRSCQLVKRSLRRSTPTGLRWALGAVKVRSAAREVAR